jgi:hypothetical protein
MSDMQGREGGEDTGADSRHESDTPGPDTSSTPREHEQRDEQSPDEVVDVEVTQRRVKKEGLHRPSSSAPERVRRSESWGPPEDQGIVPRDRPKVVVPAEPSAIERITTKVSGTESFLSEQIAESGIRLTGDGPELDVVTDVGFGFELLATPSPRELIAAVSQVDRVIRTAAGFAAYTHPELQIWSGRKPRDQWTMGAWLQDSEEWDSEIEYLGLGSLQLKLKPSGKCIKKVATNGVLVASLLANLATFTGYTVKAAASTPHSVVHSNGRKINLPPPRQHEVVVQLPPGSTITETTRLSHGKRIEWKFKVGSGGATVDGDWGQ